MIPLPTRSTRTDSLCPYTTLFRSLGWQEIELPLTTEDDLQGFDRGRPTAVAREDEAQPDIATRRGGDVEVEPCRIVVARGHLCWFAVLQGHAEEVLQDIEILDLRQGVRVVAGHGLEQSGRA